MIFFYILVVLAVAHVESSKRETFVVQPLRQTVVRPAAGNSETFVVQPLRQTIVRPAAGNRAIQPVIQNVAQPIVRQKTFQTIGNPVRTQNRVVQSVVRPGTVLRNRSIKRAKTPKRNGLVVQPLRQTVVRPAAGNRETFVVQPLRQTIVRPAAGNRVIQPVIQDVVQPIVHQKTFQTIVNPVRTQNFVAESVVRPGNVLRQRFVKRAVGVEGNTPLNGTMQQALPFLGEWEFVSSDDNFEALMKELGVGWFTRKIALAQSPSVRFELNGDEWTFTTTSAFKTTVLKFTIGKEFDEETADGRDVKTTFSFDDGKLVQTQKVDGKVVCVIVREVLKDNQLKTLAKAGSIESVRMYSKV